MRRAVLGAVVAGVAGASLMAGSAFTGGAARMASALSDPVSNSGSPNLDRACNLYSAAISESCLSAALKDIDAARAKEGLGPMAVPWNFRSLSTIRQIFVLANIERVDRGLRPYAGMSSNLNHFAQLGADAGDHPPWPTNETVYEGSSNWGGAMNPLSDHFMWMYQDGPGGPNVACTSPTAAGCWGHRHSIIQFPRTAPLMMGAGFNAHHGITQLFLGRDTRDVADHFAWSDEVPYFQTGTPENPNGRYLSPQASAPFTSWTVKAATPTSHQIPTPSTGGPFTYTYLPNSKTPRGITMTSGGLMQANIPMNNITASTGWQFQYRITDAKGASNTTTVALTVTPGNVYFRCLGASSVQAGTCVAHDLSSRYAFGVAHVGSAFGPAVIKVARGHSGAPPQDTAYGSGGDAFFYVKGAVPPGLRLARTNGFWGLQYFTLQGTPTRGGTYTFYVQVSDQGKSSRVTYLTLTVR